MRVRKVTAIVLAGVLAFGLAACGNTKEETDPGTPSTEETEAVGESAAETEEAGGEEAASDTAGGRPTDGNGLIGFSTIDLGSEYFSNVDNLVHKRFESEGYTVETISCEANAAKQVADMENLIAMEPEAIFFYAADAEALMDVCKRGREQGIKMYGMGFTGNDSDAYDAIINSNQRQSGVECAQLMADWVEKTFPDAEDGTIEVAVLGQTQSSDMTARTEGMQSIEEICPKVKIVETYDMSGATNATIKAQEYAEMALGKYPDLKGFISFCPEGSMGANEVYMREADRDAEKFGVFGVDVSSEVYDLIEKSASNASVVRGHIGFGDDFSLIMWQCLTGELDDLKDEDKNIFVPFEHITPENVGDIGK